MADFKTRHDGLDKKAAALLAEYQTLITDIQASGEFYDSFRRLKTVKFSLEKIARQNRQEAPKVDRAKGLGGDIFKKKAVSETDAAAARSAEPARPKRNIFDKAANRAALAAQAETNPNNPKPSGNPFRKPKPAEPQPEEGIVKKRKRRAEGTVLASSEENPENDD